MNKTVFFALPLLVIGGAAFLLAQGPPTQPPGGGPPGGVAPVASGWTDDGTVVRLTTEADQVGIGTASPIEKLDVVGKVNVVGDIIVSGLIDGIDLSAKVLDWDTAFAERRQWDGGAANLDSTLGRASLGLGTLSTLNAVSGGLGGTITDGTITNNDLAQGSFTKITNIGTLNHVILKDTDGPNCHKVTVNSASVLNTIIVDCVTGEPTAVTDNFEFYSIGDLAGLDRGSGWSTPWLIDAFTSAQVVSTNCFEGSRCINKISTVNNSNMRRNLQSVMTSGIWRFASKCLTNSIAGVCNIDLVESSSNLEGWIIRYTESDIVLRGVTDITLVFNQNSGWYEIEVDFNTSLGTARARVKPQGGVFTAWSNFVQEMNAISGIDRFRFRYASGINRELWIDSINIQ